MDVKYATGLGRNLASNLASGVEQIGPGGQLIVVRATTAKHSLGQFQDFVSRFRPRHPGVDVRVVDEASLPQLAFQRRRP